MTAYWILILFPALIVLGYRGFVSAPGRLPNATLAGPALRLGVYSMAAILIWKAVAARRQNPKMTEVWLYLDEHTRPAGDHARYLFASVMRDVYARFAQASLAVACAFFAVSVTLMLFGLEPYQPPRQ